MTKDLQDDLTDSKRKWDFTLFLTNYFRRGCLLSVFREEGSIAGFWLKWEGTSIAKFSSTKRPDTALNVPFLKAFKVFVTKRIGRKVIA